jgi:hypothetical protein
MPRPIAKAIAIAGGSFGSGVRKVSGHGKGKMRLDVLWRIFENYSIEAQQANATIELQQH